MSKKDIDTSMTDEITCPYCGHEHIDSWEYRNDEGSMQCGECSKYFRWDRDVSVYYSSRQVPCLNGEAPHDLKSYLFQGIQHIRCKNCNYETSKKVGK